MISSFSKETSEKLGHYVYRLIDPRNGLTFYVGKGKGNRVFAHVNQALKDYEGNDYITKEDEDDDLKLQTINEIEAAGLEVIHVIHRHGMESNKVAMEVEGAVIDAYLGLTNKANGHKNNEYGISNAEELERRYSLDEYVESPDNPKYMIIKTSKWRIEDFEGSYASRLYNATRGYWKISPRTASKHPYVLSVIDGVVKEVYKVHQWKPAEEVEGRYKFDGEIAEESIRKRFVNHRIPAKYRRKGVASPCLYSKV